MLQPYPCQTVYDEPQLLVGAQYSQPKFDEEKESLEHPFNGQHVEAKVSLKLR